MSTSFLRFVVLALIFFGMGNLPLSAGELTVAEKDKLDMIVRIKKNFVETLKAVPTQVSGRAVLPDGKPAAGFKIGGWGRSLTHPGYGHFLFDTVTDQDGRFSLDLYRPCQYWITVDDPENVFVAPDQYFELNEPYNGKTLEFQLQKVILVEGAVIDRDKKEPIADLPIWLLQAPNYTPGSSREENTEREKKQRNPRETKTDAQGRFKFAALPMEYLVTFDTIHDWQKPSKEESDLYTRTITPKNEPIHLEFEIPTPWTGTVLQKDGTPAAFYPIWMGIRMPNGEANKDAITDKNGRFVIYRPIRVNRFVVRSSSQNQWYYHDFKGEKLSPDAVFQLYSMLTGKGRLIRKSTGEPMKNFEFLCIPAGYENITTDDNGNFEIKSIYLNRETMLCHINPPDENSCSIRPIIKTFTPTEPDKEIDLGTIELEESGRLEQGTLDNLPGKTIEIEGMTLDEKPLDWSKYKGKVVLIEFWATWCGPCLQEIPNLKAVYEKYRDKGFEIVGISVDEDLNALEKGLEKLKFPWTVLADEKWRKAGKVRMYDRFAIRGVPRGILLDRDGKVVTIETRGEKLETELKRLFGE